VEELTTNPPRDFTWAEREQGELTAAPFGLELSEI